MTPTLLPPMTRPRRLLAAGLLTLLACGSDGGRATLTGVPAPVQIARSQRDFSIYLDGGSAPEVNVELIDGSPDATCDELGREGAPNPVLIKLGYLGSADSPLPSTLVVIDGADPRFPDGGPAAVLWYYAPGSSDQIRAVSGEVNLSDTNPAHPKGTFAVQLGVDGGTVAVTGTFDAPECEHSP